MRRSVTAATADVAAAAEASAKIAGLSDEAASAQSLAEKHKKEAERAIAAVKSLKAEFQDTHWLQRIFDSGAVLLKKGRWKEAPEAERAASSE